MSSMEYNREPDSPSMIQHVKELQVKLDATKDEDEQRALEEDVTGKILWLFWCGICAEVDQLLPKVTDFIREEGNTKGLRYIYWTLPSTVRGDDQVHLQRIMLDAGANTSKHQLWLARARERAKWPGINRGSPTIANQDATTSMSCQNPPQL
ncbi:hypothetical protein EDD15DRAFT_314347 [Pisolithus albus]|nr:hypothetical protein EDD15DRAFT_314347 [Pisolithus albus]